MTTAQSLCQPLHAPAAPRRHMLLDAVALYKEWQRRVRGRNELAALSDRELRDIGVSRTDMLREIDKPFWRA